MVTVMATAMVTGKKEIHNRNHFHGKRRIVTI